MSVSRPPSHDSAPACVQSASELELFPRPAVRLIDEHGHACEVGVDLAQPLDGGRVLLLLKAAKVNGSRSTACATPARRCCSRLASPSTSSRSGSGMHASRSR